MTPSDNSYRHLHLRGAVGLSRTETFDGRTYTVVPVIALMEGVIFAVNADVPEFVPLKTLMMAPQGWNGRPVVLDHPSANGRMISANTPNVLERKAFGVVFNARVLGNKLLMEAWLDPIKAKTVGEGATGTVLRAMEGKPVEVSVGVYATVEDERGSYNGKAYKATWVDMIPDHLALLSEGEVGACSNAMGCGVRTHLVTAKGFECSGLELTEECPMKAARQSLRQQVVELFRAAGDQSGHEFHGNQYSAAQRESAAKITELEGHIQRIHAGVPGNTGAAIRKRLALTKHLRNEVEKHKNVVDPTRSEAIATNSKLIPMKSGAETTGYEIHHEGQHIGTIKKTSFQDFKMVNGAPQMSRGHGFNAHYSDGTLMMQNLKRDEAVKFIADQHARKLRGASNPEGINQYTKAANLHDKAAEAHDVAHHAHTVAITKSTGHGSLAAKIAEHHSQSATRASRAANIETTAAGVPFSQKLQGHVNKSTIYNMIGSHRLAAPSHKEAAAAHREMASSLRAQVQPRTRAAGGPGSGRHKEGYGGSATPKAGDYVKIMGKVNGRGKRGTVVNSDSQGSFHVIRDDNGEHHGSFHSSDLKVIPAGRPVVDHLAEADSRFREEGMNIHHIPVDRLKEEIDYAKKNGDDRVTVKIPSRSEMSMSLDQAHAVLKEITKPTRRLSARRELHTRVLGLMSSEASS